MAEQISYIYQIIDRFTPALRKITKANEKFSAGINKVRGGLKNFGEKAGNVKNALAGIGAGAGLSIAASKAMAFEDVMTDVAKVVNFTSEEQLAKFREGVMQTGVELGKLPRNIAEIAVAGGKLGVLPENMNDFIGVVARTSVAFDMLESTAADKIGSIQAKLGLTVNETGSLMDAVNFLADNTAAGGAKMINVIARTSGTLKTLNMPTKFMAGWAAFADQIEVTPELAASGMNMMINRMSRMPGMLEKMVAAPNEAISGLLKSLAKLDQVQKTKEVQRIFGPEAGRFVLKAVNSIQLLDKTLGFVSDKTNFSGSMMKELEKKLATGKTAWSQMKAVIDIVAITLGDVLMPHIKAAAPIITKVGLAFREWTKTHPQIVKIGMAIAATVAVAAPLLVIVGMMATGIAAISGPMIAVGIALAGVGAAAYQVWKNWDYLVMDFKLGIDAIMKFVDAMKTGFLQTFEDIGNAFNFMIDNFTKAFPRISGILGKLGGFAGKIFGAGSQENQDFAGGGRGIAATNTIASKSTLNGNIIVSAKNGSNVDSTNMETNVPGNLGFNMMGGIGF